MEFGALVLGTMTFGDTVDADGARRWSTPHCTPGSHTSTPPTAMPPGGRTHPLDSYCSRRRDTVTLATKAGIPHPRRGRAFTIVTDRIAGQRRGQPVATGHRLCRPVLSSSARSRCDPGRYAEHRRRVGGRRQGPEPRCLELRGVADRRSRPRRRTRRRSSAIVAQQLYNLLARRIEDEYAEYAAVTGLTTMVYNPLGGGLLTGKHHSTEAPAEGRFGDSRLAEMYRERYWNTRFSTPSLQLSLHRRRRRTAP